MSYLPPRIPPLSISHLFMVNPKNEKKKKKEFLKVPTFWLLIKELCLGSKASTYHCFLDLKTNTVVT